MLNLLSSNQKSSNNEPEKGNTKEVSSEKEKEKDNKRNKKKKKKIFKTTSGRQYSYDSSDEDVPGPSQNSNKKQRVPLQIGKAFIYVVLPPDGGYGWLIMIFSFISQVIVDGIVLGGGMLLKYIGNEFGSPPSQVVLIISLQVGFYFLAGTVSSALINKHGFRTVAVIGCIISFLVLIISTFSVNLIMMIGFYSILGGPCLSMVWVSSQLIIGYYFERYRPIANGISCAGAGAGIAVFSYLNFLLLPDYGWRNTIRFHSGLLLLVMLISLSYVKVPPKQIGIIDKKLIEESESSSSDAEIRVHQYKAEQHEHIKIPTRPFEFYTPVVQSSDKRSCDCCGLCARKSSKKRSRKGKERVMLYPTILERTDAFYTGSIAIDEDQYMMEKNKQLKKSISKQLHNEEASRIVNHILTRIHHDVIGRKPHHHLSTSSFKQDINKVVRLLFDFNLMRCKEFQILFLSALFFPMGFNIPLVYSTVRVHLEAEEARLITPTIGISNLVFRIISGFIAFRYPSITTILCGFGMLVGGVAVLVSAFWGLNVFWFQILYATLYGMAPAFYSTLRAIIYVKTLGLEKLTNAFGLTSLAMGAGVFVGTTMGGVLEQVTGEYQYSFIFAGICIILAGFLKLILPLLVLFWAKHN